MNKWLVGLTVVGTVLASSAVVSAQGFDPKMNGLIRAYFQQKPKEAFPALKRAMVTIQAELVAKGSTMVVRDIIQDEFRTMTKLNGLYETRAFLLGQGFETTDSSITKIDTEIVAHGGTVPVSE